MKTCCIIGTLPTYFPWFTQNHNCREHVAYIKHMRSLITTLINVEKVDNFILSHSIGPQLDCAEILVALRDNQFPHVKLTLLYTPRRPATPDLGYCYAIDSKRLSVIGSTADELVNFYLHDKELSAKNINNYTIINSDGAIIVYCGGGNGNGDCVLAVDNCKRLNKEVRLVNLNNFVCYDDFEQSENFLSSYCKAYTYTDTRPNCDDLLYDVNITR